MTDTTHHRIQLAPSNSKCTLQVEWGPGSAVKLRLVHRESAWVGEVTGTSEADLTKNLIRLIKDQPFLYDKALEEYKDEARKAEAWNVIASSLNMSAEDAQVRWARLRVDFGRHRRKMKEADTSGSRTKSWPTYGLLTWLSPHVKMRAKRGQRKEETKSKTQSNEYKSNQTHADWSMNSNGSVKVEVSPSIVMHSDQEDITESFIVSPDTADYEDDIIVENSFVKHQGKLNEREVEHFVAQYERELQTNFIEDMKAAFGASPTKGNYIYSLNGGIFTWKRRLTSGLVAKLGHIKMKQIPVLEGYESVLHNSLEFLFNLEETVTKIKTENETLKRDRDLALNKVTEMASLKAQWEKKIYGQFVAVLNAKKERIQALEEMLDMKLSDDPEPTAGSSREASARKAWKDEDEYGDDEDEDVQDVKEEVDEEDPYAGDTDVDSDGDAAMEPAAASCASTSTSSSALRRGRDLFSLSFDGPDSPDPPPILAKRTRASKASATSTSTAAASLKNAIKDDPEDDVDEAVLGESTQDLIGQM